MPRIRTLFLHVATSFGNPAWVAYPYRVPDTNGGRCAKKKSVEKGSREETGQTRSAQRGGAFRDGDAHERSIC